MLNNAIIKDRVDSGLNELLESNKVFYSFYKELFTFKNVYLVGGAIRDFSLHKSPKDLDIIVNCSNRELINQIKKYNYKKNRFGGYKININGIKVDIWTISSHWAFKENLYESSFENISKGAFFNFDAITLDLKSFELDAESFIKAYNEKLLDLNLSEEEVKLNPSPVKNVQKAFKLKETMGFSFSKSLEVYCANWLNKDFRNQLDTLRS